MRGHGGRCAAVPIAGYTGLGDAVFRFQPALRSLMMRITGNLFRYVAVIQINSPFFAFYPCILGLSVSEFVVGLIQVRQQEFVKTLQADWADKRRGAVMSVSIVMGA